jgi:hypothetical protein
MFAANQKYYMKKETRGRKALPEKEKKKPLTIMVKTKFFNQAKKEVKEIERIYSTKQSHPAL